MRYRQPVVSRPQVAWQDTTHGRIDRLVQALGADELRFEVHPTTDAGLYCQQWTVAAVYYVADRTEVRTICSTKRGGLDGAVEQAVYFIERERLRAALPEVPAP